MRCSNYARCVDIRISTFSSLFLFDLRNDLMEKVQGSWSLLHPTTMNIEFMS